MGAGIGVVEQSNSTTTPLGAGETFTGVGVDVSQYPSVTLAIKTDTSGTCYIEFSPDRSNWDSSLSFSITGGVNEVHRISITRKYFRVRIVNGAASQSYLRAQVLIGEQTSLSMNLNNAIQQDSDAMVTRPTDYHYEVATGRRTGSTTWNKFGYNGDIDIGTETIWSNGGTFVRLTSAQTLSVVSTSANDVNASTGAWNVIIYGISSSREAVIEVVPMNGTTPVITTNTYWGVNRIAVYNTGSSDANVGIITATGTTDGTVQGHMPAGEGTTQQAFFFTQAGHTSLMDWLFVNVNKTTGGGTPRITIKGWVYSYVSTAKYLVFYDVIDTSVENHIELTPSQPFVVGEKSILYFEATTNVNDSTVSCRFSFIEVKN